MIKIPVDPNHFCALALAGKLNAEQTKQAATAMLTGEVRPMPVSDFSRIIKKALRIHSPRQVKILADHLEVAPSTLTRWADGVAIPLLTVQELALKALEGQDDIIITVRVPAFGERAARVMELAKRMGDTGKLTVQGFVGCTLLVMATVQSFDDERDTSDVQCPECWHKFEV